MRRTALRTTRSVVFVALAAAAWIAEAESAKRPVMAPGAEPPPMPVVEIPPAPAVETPVHPDPATPASPNGGAAVATPVNQSPTPPLPPAAFKDERAPNTAAAIPAPVDPDPKELRYRQKTGDILVAMVVRPGKPKAGTPTEIVFELQVMLPIPDPVLGDRLPVENAPLLARVTGPGTSQTFEVHPLTAKGEYGFHFTPAATGLYTITCNRTSGQPALRTQFTLGVGVETPIPADVASDPALRRGPPGARSVLGAESRSVSSTDNTAASVMDELGDQWLALRRTIGTPDAAAPMGKTLELARKLSGKVPAAFAESRETFDRLAQRFVAELDALEKRVTEPAAAAELDRMQSDTCLRCHAEFRFGIARSVERWPDFDKRETPVPPAATEKGAQRKLPVAVQGKE